MAEDTQQEVESGFFDEEAAAAVGLDSEVNPDVDVADLKRQNEELRKQLEEAEAERRKTQSRHDKTVASLDKTRKEMEALRTETVAKLSNVVSEGESRRQAGESQRETLQRLAKMLEDGDAEAALAVHGIFRDDAVEQASKRAAEARQAELKPVGEQIEQLKEQLARMNRKLLESDADWATLQSLGEDVGLDPTNPREAAALRAVLARQKENGAANSVAVGTPPPARATLRDSDVRDITRQLTEEDLAFHKRHGRTSPKEIAAWEKSHAERMKRGVYEG